MGLFTKNPAQKAAEQLLREVMDELEELVSLGMDYRLGVFELLDSGNKQLLPPDGMVVKPSNPNMFGNSRSMWDRLLNSGSQRLFETDAGRAFVREFSGNVVEVARGQFGVALVERVVTRHARKIAHFPKYIYPEDTA